MQIKVKTPAKINLTLEIVGKRQDGYHEIKSIMQMINLYDYLTFNIEQSNELNITLSGNNNDIPYNEKNIVYKAVKLFYEKTKLKPHNISIYIDKNIPTQAGLAGGSSNAAGTFLVLNKYFNNVLNKNELHELCAKLGSDLNVCLEGGCTLAKGRGENVIKLPFREYPVSLIKPHIGISAKEGYEKYSKLENKTFKDYTQKMIEALSNNKDIHEFLHNDLELGVFNEYKELQKIKQANPYAIMSGSGSTYFALNKNINSVEDYWTKTDLKTISTGCEIII
ncbi:4-(cytidine 5'-diphospho)-2-C-methyl-D-erythritol kinase [bacterium]|nr:4-(cytidine 5'-diphospho)-2-C-methyl-D-erythritol kinase [bacterium]